MSCFSYNGTKECCMSSQSDAGSSQLKEACKLTGARWAVWLMHIHDEWDFSSRHGLTKIRQAALAQLVGSNQIQSWLAGALSSGYMRWKKVNTIDLDCQRLYLFPNQEQHKLLMVGGDQLDKQSESIFKILALYPPQSQSEEVPIVFQDTKQPIWQVRAELEASYNPQTILDNILEYLSGFVPCDGSYLAVRAGEIFRTQATWKCSLPQNLDISIRKIQPIEVITTQHQGMILTASALEKEKLLPQVTELPIRSWMGIPIVIGQRVIGLVAFVATLRPGFDQEMLQQATHQVSTLAYNVENAIVFAEATRYLHQLALLNELAVTASLSININEVSRRVMQRLRRAFDTDWAAVFLFSPEDNILREYGGEGRGEIPLTVSAETSLVSLTIAYGRPICINDLQSEPHITPTDPKWCSELAVPLRYREKVIGAIDLASKEADAFSMQDEQLLILIAGQLAGLFENMRLNEELRAYIRQLEESQRALIQAEKMAIAGRLTASIAHEINNPLQAVSNCLHLAGRRELTLDDRQNYLVLAQEELDRLMHTVQRMLDFYRPGALDRQPTNVHALLQKMLLLMEKQFEDHDIQVNLNFASDLPYVYAVGDQIQQVFLNLALNASEAMPDGGSLYIETYQNQDQVRIIFQDTGLGVPASKRKTIFEPFVSSKPGGTGLGLAISYGIITAHGGSLELVEPGEKGARFQITLKTGENT
jgi:signal transduction histidine kinase